MAKAIDKAKGLLFLVIGAAVLGPLYTNCSSGFSPDLTKNFSSGDLAGPPLGSNEGPPISPPTGTTPIQNDVVDASGNVVASAYVVMAGKMSTEEGITYRYGAPSTAARTTTTWFGRTNNARVYAPEGGDWQVGQENRDPGDYYSNSGNIGFIPDNPAQRLGVTNFKLAIQSYNATTQRPEPTYIDDPHGRTAKTSKPVAMGRGYGRPGWNLEGVIAYQDGTLAVGMGGNTSLNYYSTKLAANKVPTAVAITNSNEFALVTVWDTVALKGQIAVVALAGLCNGGTVANPDCGDYWGEWGAVYPGLSNMGNLAYMKVLGYVDLPENLRAPTEISVTTGWDPWLGAIVAADGGASSAYKLQIATNETNRQTFVSGRNVGAYAKGGVAIVVSKSEKRAAFVDLKPLIAYFNSRYFGTRADFENSSLVGAGENQWPYAFSYMPETAKPKIVQTLTLDARPTAVRATLWGKNLRAFIATEEGSVRLFDINGYGNGSGTTNIREVGRVAVGPNPTSLSYLRASVEQNPNDGLVVLSRGDRAIRWLTLSTDHNSATVKPNVLTDSRLVDPIAIEDQENHGTETYLVSVVDYGGKMLHNYRYGPTIFWTNQGPGMACPPPLGCGLGPSNQPASVYPFEHGGDRPIQGKPFFVSGANIP